MYNVHIPSHQSNINPTVCITDCCRKSYVKKRCGWRTGDRQNPTVRQSVTKMLECCYAEYILNFSRLAYRNSEQSARCFARQCIFSDPISCSLYVWTSMFDCTLVWQSIWSTCALFFPFVAIASLFQSNSLFLKRCNNHCIVYFLEFSRISFCTIFLFPL